MFGFRSILRKIFFEKILLEFDKSFNVIVSNSCFQEEPLEVSIKKAVLKNPQYSQEIPMLESLVNKVARPATLLKRDSNVGVFLGILRNF